MTSLRSRLGVFLGVFTVSGLSLLGGAYYTFRVYRDLRAQLELSYSVRDAAQDLTVAKKERGALAGWAPKLVPARRGEELLALIKEMDGANARMVSERHTVFLKNEAEFQRFTRTQLLYQEQKLIYFGALELLLLLAVSLSLHVFMSRAVLKPLRELSRKMTDFLHDRYTYQFGVPTGDEIGEIQTTFNSVAQRVLANMQELRTLDEAKSEFLSIASHELRTPLTSIKGSLSLLRSGIAGSVGAMADNLLTIAENETDRLIRLINDILDLAKIEARKLPLQQNWHALDQLVRVSLQSLQGLAAQADVHLKAGNLPKVDLYIDSDRMQQVLTNLLSNAIKFSPKGKAVVVHVEVSRRNEILIEVRDNGRGIDPQDQEAIFQKFRQASNAKNPLVKGTGLGLAIARALVEQHGGEIGVRSVPGEGSTFFFTLPEWREARVSPPEASVA